jgi:hypothetical protein
MLKTLDQFSNLMLRGDHNSAANLLRATIEKAPSSKIGASLSIMLAGVEGMQQNTSEMLRLCRIAERDDPTRFVTQLTIGTLLSASKGFEGEALKKADEALRLAITTGQEAQAHGLKAYCFLHLGKRYAARKSLRKYRAAWCRSRAKNNVGVAFVDEPVINGFIAAGIGLEDCRHLCRIALLRARRQRFSKAYQRDLRQILAAAKGKR